MTTVKKIILFLFGIVLIVFGNKAAIDTIFKDNDGLKAPDSEEKEIANKNPVITEEVDTKETEVITPNNDSSSLKEEEIKVSEVSKKEISKASEPKPKDNSVKEQSAKVAEKKETPKVKEAAAQTKIEPVQEESAAASE